MELKKGKRKSDLFYKNYNMMLLMTYYVRRLNMTYTHSIIRFRVNIYEEYTLDR